MAFTIQEILDRLEPIPEAGCLVWTGYTQNGYGIVFYQGKNRRVHRVIFEALVGPVPDGLHLDHLCRVRDCANIHHLESVTSRENTMRGNNFCAKNAAKTSCKRGHELIGRNLILTRAGRECRTCRNMLYAKYRKRDKLASYGVQP